MTESSKETVEEVVEEQPPLILTAKWIEDAKEGALLIFLREALDRGMTMPDGFTAKMQRALLRDAASRGSLDRIVHHGLIPLWSMRGWDFSGCTLRGLSVSRAIMESAFLEGVDLSCAFLTRCNLGEIKAAGVVMTGTNGERSNFSGATLTRANMEMSCWLRTDFSGADMGSIKGDNSRFVGANLEGVNLKGASLKGADFQGAKLKGANMEKADLRGVDFRGADLRDVSICGADIRGAKFASTKVEGLRFTGATGVTELRMLKDHLNPKTKR